MNPAGLRDRARTVADRASCRTVNEAIVAYVGVHGEDPKTVGQVAPYVTGDISAYRIVNGRAAGPGC